MQAAFQQYIEKVQALAREASEADVVRGVESACHDLARAEPTLGPEHRQMPEEGHGRNLLFHDAEQGFVVVAMIWPPGYEGCAHDHSSWCVMSVLEGTVEVKNYRRTDQGGDVGPCKLEETDAFQAGVGSVAAVDPPPAHYHMVSNASATEFAVTLHTYGTNAMSCQVVDLDKAEAREVHMAYHNEAACQD